MNAQAMMNKIKDGQLDDAFRRVYVTDGEVAKQKSRYMELLTTFAAVSYTQLNLPTT